MGISMALTWTWTILEDEVAILLITKQSQHFYKYATPSFIRVSYLKCALGHNFRGRSIDHPASVCLIILSFLMCFKTIPFRKEVPLVINIIFMIFIGIRRGLMNTEAYCCHKHLFYFSISTH